MMFREVFINKYATISLLLFYFGNANGMTLFDADTQFREIKKFCNVERYDRASGEIIFSSSDRFDKSLELLGFYTDRLRKIKNESVRFFQHNALEIAIEELSKALEIAEIDASHLEIPSPRLFSALRGTYSGTSSGRRIPTVTGREPPSDTLSDKRRQDILKLKKLVIFLSESRLIVQDSVLKGDNEEKKAEFLDCILRSLDAIRGIELLIPKPETTESSGDSEPERLEAESSAAPENLGEEVEITMENLADFDDV